MKKSIYAAAALAFAVVLSGCGSSADAAVEQPAGTTAASETAAAPAMDPLDSLPGDPFGLDAGQIAAAPERFGIQWQFGDGQAGTPVAGALTAFLQIQWLANERQVYVAGSDLEKIQGSLRDAEHFVAPEHLEPERKKVQDALAYTALREKEGDDAPPLSEAIYYPLHLGSVATPDSEVPTEVDELRHEKWPDPSEADDYNWLQIDGEEAYSFFRMSSEIPLTPRIHHVYGQQEGHSSEVNILAYLDYEIPLVDGRTAVVSYSTWYGMKTVNGEWKLDGWRFSLNDQKPTISVKQ